MVRWRPGHIALLVFQALWLNVILPGHTRGVVTLPGTPSTEIRDDSGSCCSRSSQPSSQDNPSESDRAARCAVCFFAMRITAPPAINLRPPAMELLGVEDPPARDDFVSRQARRCYLGRAPPLL